MSLLKWLFGDSEAVTPEKLQPTLQQELAKIKSDVENKVYLEAYERYSSIKQGLITRRIEECKAEAYKGNNRHYFNFEGVNQRFDFTSDLAWELRKLDLKATKSFSGIILVEW